MTTLDPIQASPDYAEARFHFLIGLGFHLDERWVSGGNSYRDGWRLCYSSSTVRVTVSYLDMQLEIVFTKSDTSADYLLVDRELFARRSGFHGNMFPPQKLTKAIDRMSADVQEHYGSILAGDDAVWQRIVAALHAPKQKAHLP